jgi:hypothetical protein
MARKSVEKARRSASGPLEPARRAAAPEPADSDGGLRPWHVLLVATLVAAAVGVYLSRGSSMASTVTVAVAIATVALAAVGVARMVTPLLSPETGEQTEMLGGRTRAALEREKMLVLRSIKEIEFDRAMKKISDADFREMSTRLRSRAAGLMRQLDGDGSGYRALIERDLYTRVGAAPSSQAPAGDAR